MKNNFQFRPDNVTLIELIPELDRQSTALEPRYKEILIKSIHPGTTNGTASFDILPYAVSLASTEPSGIPRPLQQNNHPELRSTVSALTEPTLIQERQSPSQRISHSLACWLQLQYAALTSSDRA